MSSSGTLPRHSRIKSRVLADLLVGCWRAEPGSASLSADQLEALMPALAGSGVAALAWRRLRHSPLAGHPAVQELGRLHMKQALDAKLQERKVAKVFERLSSEGIEALLVKGWATGRLYPEAGLRPSGDVDLLIWPQDAAATERLLGIKVDDDTNGQWDIKTRVPSLYRVTSETLFAHREQFPLGASEVTVLGHEEHLRILCLHFLKHGAWRPLWLCDIAALLENRPVNFHWERCLGRDRRTADGVACALGLAHQLLGASVADTPVMRRAQNLPFWLVESVLREWETPQLSQHQPAPLIIESLRQRKSVLQAILKRWPNPIQAAMVRRSALDWPPLPAQTLIFAASTWHFVKRTVRTARR